METNPASTLPRPAAANPGVPPLALAIGALLIAGLGWLHWEFLVRSFRAAVKDPNWSHILVVPAISAYYIYLNRDRLFARPARLCWWGLPIVVAGVFSYLWWIYPGRNDMFRGYSMILTIFGIVLFTQGWKRMGVLWFPVAYLALAVKIPDSLWQQIAFVLQQIAAAGSEITLTAFGAILDFDLITSGQDMTMRYVGDDGRLVEHGFSIAEACSGLRMLMAFCALGVALAFLWDRRWWQRLIMVAMAVPIAIAVNVGRVTALGLLNLVDPEYAKGDFHIAVGMAMLIPAALLFMALGWALDKMLIVDEEAREAERAKELAGSDETSDSLADTGHPAVALRTLALGSVLMFAVGVTYLLVLNGAGAVRAIESLSAGVSLALAVPAAAAVGVMFWLAKRWTPGMVAGLALVAGMVLTSAVGLQTVVAKQEAVLLKQPVEMRHEFFTLPKQLGDWELHHDEDPLPKEREDELGTEHYLTRTYRDTTLDENDPKAYGRVHLAYYTGMIDTVPHVPDRCWVAAGMTNTGLEEIELNLSPAGGSPDDGRAGLIVPTQLRDPVDGRSHARLAQTDIVAKLFSAVTENRRTVNTAYFFVANGSYYASPNSVRLLGFDIRDKYSYYCKVEVMFSGIEDPALSEQRTEELLSVLLPEIMACLPDWVDVKEGRWPANATAEIAAR